MPISRSAGGVVLNRENKVLIVNQGGVSWSLPKGHIEKGEESRNAAAREIAEESGITFLEYLDDLGTYIRTKIGIGGKGEDRTRQKEITMYLYKTMQTKIAPIDPHNPEARWVEIDKVADQLTHPIDKEWFKSKIHRIREVIA